MHNLLCIIINEYYYCTNNKTQKWRKNKIRKKLMLYNRLFEPKRTTARCCVNAG